MKKSIRIYLIENHCKIEERNKERKRERKKENTLLMSVSESHDT
jgi:hypothetical protein